MGFGRRRQSLHFPCAVYASVSMAAALHTFIVAQALIKHKYLPHMRSPEHDSGCVLLLYEHYDLASI